MKLPRATWPGHDALLRLMSQRCASKQNEIQLKRYTLLHNVDLKLEVSTSHIFGNVKLLVTSDVCIFSYAVHNI